MLGEASRERWIQSYLYVVSGFALFQMEGREADCEHVVRKALLGKQEIGDVIGMAYALDVLGWLAAKTGQEERAAWLLGAAQPLWERGGSVRFSGTAIMEDFHQQAERTAAEALGPKCYETFHNLGVTHVRKQLDELTPGQPRRMDLQLP